MVTVVWRAIEITNDEVRKPVHLATSIILFSLTSVVICLQLPIRTTDGDILSDGMAEPARIYHVEPERAITNLPSATFPFLISSRLTYSPLEKLITIS